MKPLQKYLLACIPLLTLAACGGGDTADRLDVADPVVRFVHASTTAPNITLFKGITAQPDATDVPYKFASDYFDVGTDAADWSAKTTTGAVTLGTVTINPLRGNKYTIVALSASPTDNSAYLIVDPYNKPLTSDSTHLRVMNASFNAGNIDLYLNIPGTNIAGVTPLIANTAYQTSGPASGSDSVDVAAGTYQLVITAAGSKTALFSTTITFGANKDVLLLSVPDAVLPAGIKVLEKIEGTPGATEVPAG